MAGAGEVADTDVTEKDKIIDSLLVEGRKMIKQGVFALPKLAWNATYAHPEEKRVLAMIGFLLDAYHKEAWWWELFEMWRKFMLAGAIILVPTEGGKQIAFALFISTICLYTSLRTSPYIVENLLKLHIMSLTAQCITLFYALLLEIQNLSSVAKVCEDGKTCNQTNLSDAIMESLLSLLQVSVFLLPVGLLLRDKGVFDAVGKTFNHVIEEARKRARVSMGHTAVETKKVRWPDSFTDSQDESARTKGLGQATETTYSSRKLPIAQGAAPHAAGSDGRPSTADCTAGGAAFEIGGGVGGNLLTAAQGLDFKVEVAESTNNITGDLMPSLSDGQAARAENTAGERDVEMNVFRLFPDSVQRSGDISAAASGSSDEDQDREMPLDASIFSRRSGGVANLAASSPAQILNRIDIESSAAHQGVQAVLKPAETSTPAAAHTNMFARSLRDAICGNGCAGPDSEATHWFVVCVCVCM